MGAENSRRGAGVTKEEEGATVLVEIKSFLNQMHQRRENKKHLQS
jgi:hypothetical protein